MNGPETEDSSIIPKVDKFYIYELDNQAHIYHYDNNGYYSIGLVYPIVLSDEADQYVNIGKDGIPEETVKIDQPVEPSGKKVNQHFNNKEQALTYLRNNGYNITGANANDSGIYIKSVVTGGTHKRRGKGNKKGKSKKGGKRLKGVKSKKGGKRVKGVKGVKGVKSKKGNRRSRKSFLSK